MKPSLKDLVQVTWDRYGFVAVKHGPTGETCAAEILHSLGYRRAKVGKKVLYFRRCDGRLAIFRAAELNNCLIEFLHPGNFNEWPDGVRVSDVANSF